MVATPTFAQEGVGRDTPPDVRFGSKADIRSAKSHVRFKQGESHYAPYGSCEQFDHAHSCAIILIKKRLPLIVLSLLRSRTFHRDLTTIVAYSKSQCLQ